MKFSCFFLFLVLLTPAKSIGQDLNKFLVLDNLNNSKRIKYFQNDMIRLELKNQTKVSGKIHAIKDSSIVIENIEIILKEVQTVFTSRANFVTHGFTVLFAGWGIGFVALDSFNNLTNGDRPVINMRAVIAGAALVSAAGLIKLASRKKYKIKGSRVLKIMNTSPV